MEEDPQDGLLQGENAPVREAVAALFARSMAHPWRPAQVEAALASDRSCLAVEEDAAGRPVGAALGRRVTADLVEIDLVAVDPGHRRRGVARRVLEALMDAEREGGVREFRLELAAGNAAARALYAATGFVVVGRRARYYPDGDDALLLTWTAPERSDGAEREQRRED